MRSKFNMVKMGWVKYSSSKWEDERLPGLRGLKRAPSLAAVERCTSMPYWRAHWTLSTPPKSEVQCWEGTQGSELSQNKCMMKIDYFATSSPRLQSNLYLRTQLVKNGCTYCEKYLNQDMNFHVKCYIWSMTFTKKLQKFVKPLDVHVKFPIPTYMWSLHVSIFSQKYLDSFLQTLNHNHQEELSLQHTQRVGSYGQFQPWWTDSPKSPCNSMGPWYFDIRTRGFNIRTLDSAKFEYVKGSTYIEFE